MNLPVPRSGTEARTSVSAAGNVNDGLPPDPAPGSSDATISASAPEVIASMTRSELRALKNEFLGLHRRHPRDARINSESILNTTMRRINRWARFVRVNDSVRNTGRLRDAVLIIVDRINLPDPCGDGNINVETGNNMQLVSLLMSPPLWGRVRMLVQSSLSTHIITYPKLKSTNSVTRHVQRVQSYSPVNCT